MKRIAYLIAALWTVAITGLYFKYHSAYAEPFRNGGGIAGIDRDTFAAAIVAVLLYLGFWFVLKLRNNTIRISAPLIAGTVIGTGVVITVTLFLARGLASEASVGMLVGNLFIQLTVLIIILGAFIGIAAALGKTMLRLVRIHDESSVLTALVAIGIGLLCIEFMLFVIALFGLLNLYTVLGVIVCAIAISLPEAIKIVVALWRWRLDVSIHAWSAGAVTGATTVLVMVLNLVHIIRPVPNGWDEFVRYLNTPKLLADGGSLISGIHSYPHELVMSMGFTLFGSLPIALGLSVVMGVLASVAVYEIARRFVPARASFIAACLFLLVPFVIFQSSREVKVDLATTFFAATAVAAFMEWWDTATHRWLMISGLLVGAAIATKYTSIIVAAALGIALLYAIVKRDRRVIPSLAGFGLAMLIAFIPWGLYFSMNSPGMSIAALTRGVGEAPRVACVAPAASDTTGTSVKPEQTGTAEELGRYLGYGPTWRQHMLLPWTVTMNPVVRGMNNDLGFIFLALIPVLLCFVPWKSGGDPMVRDRWTELGIITVVYWLLWALLAKGVIWYGMPGITLLLVVLVGGLENKRLDAQFRRLGYALLLMSCLSAGIAKLYFSPNNLQLRYIARDVTTNEYIDALIPKYREIYDIVNATPPQPDAPNLVYRIGTFIPYFIHENDRRLYTDDQMDMLTCIRTGRTDAEAAAELKRQGFRFLILDLNAPTIDETPDQTLTQKWRSTAEFINTTLNILVIAQGDEYRSKIVLAEIP